MKLWEKILFEAANDALTSLAKMAQQDALLSRYRKEARKEIIGELTDDEVDRYYAGAGEEE